jgi:hypothetical protein
LNEPRGGTRSAPLFSPQDTFLLARIDELEQRLRAGAATQTEQEVIAWTRTA